MSARAAGLTPEPEPFAATEDQGPATENPRLDRQHGARLTPGVPQEGGANAGAERDRRGSDSSLSSHESSGAYCIGVRGSHATAAHAQAQPAPPAGPDPAFPIPPSATPMASVNGIAYTCGPSGKGTGPGDNAGAVPHTDPGVVAEEEFLWMEGKRSGIISATADGIRAALAVDYGAAEAVEMWHAVTESGLEHVAGALLWPGWCPPTPTPSTGFSCSAPLLSSFCSVPPLPSPPSLLPETPVHTRRHTHMHTAATRARTRPRSHASHLQCCARLLNRHTYANARLCAHSATHVHALGAACRLHR